MTTNRYVGEELDLFATAKNWKGYWSDLLRPFVSGNVLEVGAGMGVNAEWLVSPGVAHYHFLEPDPRLSRQLRSRLRQHPLPAAATVSEGTLDTIPAYEKFDTILYIDVLEHIEDDRREAAMAADRLADGGHMVILSPAFPTLYSPFDAAIGHFRRYTKRTLQDAMPPNVKQVLLSYVDSVGMAASLVNRLLLQQSNPTQSQIDTWDRWLVRLSKIVDPLVGYRFGKSIIGVWAKRQG